MARENQTKDQLMEKVLYVNRCSKVVKGGRKFSFSALVLVGDGQDKVGYGFAKANELTAAIKKGGEYARSHVRTFPKERRTIPHEVMMKWDGTTILLRPLPEGTGVIAGSKVRSILEMCGYTDIMAKIIGSSSPINQVQATFKALEKLVPHDEIKRRRI